MSPESKDHLETVLEEGESILAFISGHTFHSYQEDKKTRFAVERAFEIIGESLNRINRFEPEILESIKDYRNIISFRNILAHAYDHIEDKIVWGIIESDLEELISSVKRIL